MSLSSILKLFTPKDKVFYSLFEEVANTVAKMGSLMKDVVSESDFDKRAGLISKMEDLEHVNDDLTHKFLQSLAGISLPHLIAKIFTIWLPPLMIFAIIFSLLLKKSTFTKLTRTIPASRKWPT